MADWPNHGAISGPIVMIGFGSIDRGTLPLIERHFTFDRSKMVVIDPSDADRKLLDERGIRFIHQGVTDNLFPLNGTPLYTATNDTYDDMLGAFDEERINAVVLLSDGRNEDPNNTDLEALIRHLREGAEGERAQPVRIFAIAYGGDADLETLRRIAEATNAQVYDASDATSINRVFTAVISNF